MYERDERTLAKEGSTIGLDFIRVHEITRPRVCFLPRQGVVRVEGTEGKQGQSRTTVVPGTYQVDTGCENVETTVRKWRILFARFVVRMDNERLPKRVMFGDSELDGGKRYSGGQEQKQDPGLDGLSRARPIVVQLAHRSAALDVGSEEAG